MPRILIAEDSYVIQRSLVGLLENEQDIEIVGIANNGEEALSMCHSLKPDLVTMDIFMPVMDGLNATKRIMEECPTRIVIISAMANDMNNSFEAMRAGAIDIIAKPHGILAGNYNEVKKQLIHQIGVISRARPSISQKRAPYVLPEPLCEPTPKSPISISPHSIPMDFVPKIVCIAGSTGAPTIIADILSHLPPDYPFPIIVIQHISRGFAGGLASWLNSTMPLDIKIANKGDMPQPGQALVAPDDNHLVLDDFGRVDFISPDMKMDYVPSIDHTFLSVAKLYKNKAVGVLLSGMGRDGVSGLSELHDNGSVTLVQNEETSIIYGMGKIAVAEGAATKTLSPTEISNLLIKFQHNLKKL